MRRRVNSFSNVRQNRVRQVLSKMMLVYRRPTFSHRTLLSHQDKKGVQRTQMDRKSKNEAENWSVSAHQPQTAEVCGNSTALAAPATWYSLDAKLKRLHARVVCSPIRSWQASRVQQRLPPDAKEELLCQIQTPTFAVRIWFQTHQNEQPRAAIRNCLEISRRRGHTRKKKEMGENDRLELQN